MIDNATADSFTIDNYDKIYPNALVTGGFSGESRERNGLIHERYCSTGCYCYCF